MLSLTKTPLTFQENLSNTEADEIDPQDLEAAAELYDKLNKERTKKMSIEINDLLPQENGPYMLVDDNNEYSTFDDIFDCHDLLDSIIDGYLTVFRFKPNDRFERLDYNIKTEKFSWRTF